MRQEGHIWAAYFAESDMMEGAKFIGSIHMSAVVNNPERKQAFMDMMKGVIAEILDGATDGSTEWGGAEPAPEHEKAGRA